MGLGSVDLVSLADAREKSLACRRQIAEGIDPQEESRRAAQAAALEAARAISFEDAADAYITAHQTA